jgi:Ca-activated chloride channel homolog
MQQPPPIVVAQLFSQTEAASNVPWGSVSEDGIVDDAYAEELTVLETPREALTGSIINVRWTGTANHGDLIAIGAVSNKYLRRIHFSHVDGSTDSVELRMPTIPGMYKIRYFHSNGKEVASSMITLRDPVATISAPEKAVAGSIVQVQYTGPRYNEGFVSLGLVGFRPADSIHCADLDGSSTALSMPLQAGTYCIRYMLQQNDKVIASCDVVVVEDPESPI